MALRLGMGGNGREVMPRGVSPQNRNKRNPHDAMNISQEREDKNRARETRLFMMLKESGPEKFMGGGKKSRGGPTRKQ